ncbi:hypothetical protein [Actinoplanes sp. NPDC023714]|uniref:hypothetical protein n=1 Tax=Actinoplanes sp. NPDC023714 TaxID=3154322 RepID=UPI0033FB6FD8
MVRREFDGSMIVVPDCQDADMDDAVTVSRQEFEAAEGGFLPGLRGAGLVWDRSGCGTSRK